MWRRLRTALLLLGTLAGCAMPPEDAPIPVHDCTEPHAHAGDALCACDVEHMQEQMQRIELSLAEIQGSL